MASSVVDDERALIAHVLRRTTFGPFPGQTERWVGRDIGAVVEAVLTAQPMAPGTPELSDDDADAGNGPIERWLTVLADPAAGLHEKLVWFWHGHLTTSYDKVGQWRLLWRQHLLLRRHALGNFRTLLHEITRDPAMLVYLDGAGSRADAPNENFGRELLELFALGRGNYTQGDVRAAAIALAGMDIDDDGDVVIDSDAVNHEPRELLGRKVFGAHDVVDAVCEQPACAPFLVTELFRFLCGADPEPATLHRLADVFVNSGLEIRPLVTEILYSSEFLDSRSARPRYPIEWVTAASAVFGFDDIAARREAVERLGQVPFEPPNVAGWPSGSRWLSPSHTIVRAALAIEAPPLAQLAAAADPVTAAFERAAIYDPTPTTRDAVTALAATPGLDPRARAAAILACVVSSPEFTLS
ncbi:DUF1800 family protein [Nocardia sp. NPDC004604]|uniref:DUF1800 domain-containing protein n=1 Tax=Nocardia sp. NPDC004604 TaxID=3157013 RepID=UPI0033A8F5FB